jgi:MFS transporter, DHA1 family, multidrug resistance protein
MISSAQSPQRSLAEFIALAAALFATIALSIDAMLPALPDIATQLSPDNANLSQLVITSFVFGMGIGTLFMGPLSDAYGRKPVILCGSALYAVAALICWIAPSLDTLLAARVLQGIGAAAARVVVVAIVRDQFEGRAMARIMSFVMMVFTLVPAIAPLVGTAVIAVAGWREIFLVYVVFAGVTAFWLWSRQPETLPRDKRRPLSVAVLWASFKEVFSHRVVVVSILGQTLTLGMLFATLSSMQGIFDIRFGRAETFSYWFAFIALASMGGSALNARVVMRLGMRRVTINTYFGIVVLTIVLLALNLGGLLSDDLAFAGHILWSVALFAMMGLTMGNLNALAMEPLGHIAGLASSVMTSIATVASVLLAVPIGQMFDGTAIPLMTGVAVYAGLALLLLRYGVAERAPA